MVFETFGEIADQEVVARFVNGEPRHRLLRWPPRGGGGVVMLLVAGGTGWPVGSPGHLVVVDTDTIEASTEVDASWRAVELGRFPTWPSAHAALMTVELLPDVVREKLHWKWRRDPRLPAVPGRQGGRRP